MLRKVLRGGDDAGRGTQEAYMRSGEGGMGLFTSQVLAPRSLLFFTPPLTCHPRPSDMEMTFKINALHPFISGLQYEIPNERIMS